MNKRDKKIRIGLTVFFCSITLITLIKGTYAYPSTMENNSDNGVIIPLGGEGGSCPASTPTPTPTKTPTPTPTKTPTPTSTKTPTPVRTPIVTPTPIKTPTPVETPVKENACYVCSTDNNNFYWGLDKPEAGTNSCDSTWSITNKSYDECQPHEEIPSNPNTGDIMLYIAYMVAISALVYSGLNFYKYKKNTK